MFYQKKVPLNFVAHASFACTFSNWRKTLRMENMLFELYRDHFLSASVNLWCSDKITAALLVEFRSMQSGLRWYSAKIRVSRLFNGNFFQRWYFACSLFHFNWLHSRHSFHTFLMEFWLGLLAFDLFSTSHTVEKCTEDIFLPVTSVSSTLQTGRSSCGLIFFFAICS